MTVSTPPLQSAATVGRILLKLRRSQQQGMMGRMTFTLNARVELTPDTHQLVEKYRLGSTVVYDSQARRKYAATASGHFGDAAVLSNYSIGRSVLKSIEGAVNAAAMALSLRLTVSDLLGGRQIDCKDLDELLGAEAAIVEACKSLKAYLETALTFDGREDLLEF